VRKPSRHCNKISANTNLEDSEEDGSFELGIRGETNSHKPATFTQVINSLGISRRRGSGDDSGMGTWATGNLLDICYDVAAGLEVDPGVSAELLAELSLLVPSVDGDDSEAEVLGVLDGQVTETAASAGENDPFVW
jgi:hypothetical protein